MFITNFNYFWKKKSNKKFIGVHSQTIWLALKQIKIKLSALHTGTCNKIHKHTHMQAVTTNIYTKYTHEHHRLNVCNYLVFICKIKEFLLFVMQCMTAEFWEQITQANSRSAIYSFIQSFSHSSI